MISAQIDELRKLADGQAPYRDARAAMLEAADTIWQLRDDLQRANADNDRLREQMERLVTLLRVDCDIDASWDGLRRFWSIGLTEDGCLMRDRACKAEAENAKLRELVRKVLQFERAGCEGCPYASTCDVDCLYEPNCPMREDIERDMRELEVDACPNCGAKVVEPTTNDVDVEVDA